MEKETIEMFKNMLQEQQDSLTIRIKQAVSGLIEQENFYSDPIDRAAVDVDQGFLLRIKDRESRLLKKIKDALERIEDGSFGICESCGDDIRIERLQARPVATHCIRCKMKLEMQENRLRSRSTYSY